MVCIITVPSYTQKILENEKRKEEQKKEKKLSKRKKYGKGTKKNDYSTKDTCTLGKIPILKFQVLTTKTSKIPK